MRRGLAPWVAGIIIGVTAVLAGTLGGISPPEAYGLCTTCHGRDLVLGVARWFSVETFDMPTIWPALTVVGVVIGAWLARRVAGEAVAQERFSRREATAKVVQGFTVMSFALLAMGCPIRLTVSAANLSIAAVIGLAGVGLGIWLGVQYFKVRA